MQKTLTNNSIYIIIYTVVNILFSFLTSIYVSRVLFPAGVGRVASAQNIASYFVTITALLSIISMTLCVIPVMNLKLSSTVGFFIKVLCGVFVYLLSSIVLKNEMVFEILQKVKGKTVHKD